MICLGDNFVSHKAVILSLASNFKFHGEKMTLRYHNGDDNENDKKVKG